MGVAVRRTGKRIGSATSWDGVTRLAILAVCFGLGALGGFLFSALSGDSVELMDYLQQYFQSAGQGGGLEPSLAATVWDLVRWPLAVFGVTLLVAVPVLFVVAADAFRQSLSRLPGAPSAPIHWTERIQALAPCAGLLVLAAALQQTVMPALFSAVCARLLNL